MARTLGLVIGLYSSWSDTAIVASVDPVVTLDLSAQTVDTIVLPSLSRDSDDAQLWVGIKRSDTGP